MSFISRTAVPALSSAGHTTRVFFSRLAIVIPWAVIILAVNDHIVIAASDLGDPGRLKPLVFEKIHFPEPFRAPFHRLSSKMGVVNVKRMDYNILEEFDPDRIITVTAQALAADTTVVVDDFTAIVDDMMFEVVDPDGGPTGEIVHVTATPTTSTVTIVRSFGGGVATIIPALSTLRLLGIYRSEQDSSPTVIMRATDELTQHTATLARSIEITQIMQGSQMYGPGEETRLNAQTVRMFARDTENSLLFNQFGRATSAGDDRQTFDGWRTYAIRNNQFNAGGTLTFDFFVSSIQQANRLGGPAEKFIFCGNALAAGIAKWGQKFGIVRQDAKSKSLGFMIDTILIPGIAAPVHVVPSYDFADRSEMGIVDFRGLKIAEFSPMKFDKGPANYGIQTDGKYTYKTQMFRRFGLMCTNGWSQGIFTNVDRIAA